MDLKWGRPEVEKLLAALQPRMALEKAKKLLPGSAPDYLDGNIFRVMRSHDNFRALAALHLLHAQAAQAAGAWEDAQKAYGRAIATTEAAQMGLATQGQRCLEEAMKTMADAEAIKKEKATKLKELMDATNQGKDNRAEIRKIQWDIKDQESLLALGRETLTFIGDAKKQLAADLELQKEAQRAHDQHLALEAQALALVKKGSPRAYVAQAFADKRNATLYPELRAQSDFLQRLATLDPANRKVQTALKGLLQGKSAFAAPSASNKTGTKTK